MKGNVIKIKGNLNVITVIKNFPLKVPLLHIPVSTLEGSHSNAVIGINLPVTNPRKLNMKEFTLVKNHSDAVIVISLFLIYLL